MLNLIRDITDHVDYAVLPVLIYSSTASLLAVAAGFAPGRRRRAAALRALRAFLRRPDDGGVGDGRGGTDV